MEKRIRQRLELQSTHAQQMHFKTLRRKAEEDEEEEFRQQVKGNNFLYPIHQGHFVQQTAKEA